MDVDVSGNVIWMAHTLAKVIKGEAPGLLPFSKVFIVCHPPFQKGEPKKFYGGGNQKGGGGIFKNKGENPTF